jgi:hypothetical protein
MVICGSFFLPKKPPANTSAQSRLFTERSLKQLKEYLMKNSAEYEELVTK